MEDLYTVCTGKSKVHLRVSFQVHVCNVLFRPVARAFGAGET
jgi:hypothetical protein